MIRSSPVFIRVHGAFMMFLGVTMAIVATVGHVASVGPWYLLGENTLGYLGLAQAYTLFAVIGLAIFGASWYAPRRPLWHLCGALGHLPPLTLTLVYIDWMMAANLPLWPLAMHAILVVLELSFAVAVMAGARRGDR